MIDLLFGATANVIPATTTLAVIAGMFVLAVLDIWRREVEDYATIALAVIAVVGMRLESITSQQWVTGLVSAAIAFAVYLALGVQGVMGGGDVKLSVVPAFTLGAINPILGVWWVGVSIVIQCAFFTASRVLARTSSTHSAAGSSQVMPHVPAMTSGMVAAAVIFPVLA